MSDNWQPRPPRAEPSQVIRRDPAYRPVATPPPHHRPPPPRRPQQRPPGYPPPPEAWRPAYPPPPQPRPAKAKRKRRWPRRIAVSMLAVLLAGLVGVVGGGYWLDTRLHRTPVLSDYPGRPASGRGTTWLLVGSDSRGGLSPQQQGDLATGGDTGNGRTDTIMLVHLPGIGSSTPTSLVSIPRDSYVKIPGHGSDKINAAFAVGGGPLLTQTVEQATGIRLDHYAEIGFSGFAAVVDALGGVTMCPAEPISDPLAGIDLPSGCQKLNGRSALGYVRTRATPRADLDRMVNQREFMSALLHRVNSPAVWLDPFRWYPLATGATDALSVDEGVHAWDLARLAWALRGSTVSATVPISEFTDNDAGSVVVWNSDVAKQMFAALASDQPLPAEALADQP